MICKKTNTFASQPRTQYEWDMQTVAISNFAFLVKQDESLTNRQFADRIASYSHSKQAQEVARVLRDIPDVLMPR